jgi:hypothetical protein
MMENVEAYTVKSFKARWPIGNTSLYAEIKAGRLKARKMGRRTLILREDAERWAKSLPAIGAADQY